MILAAPHADNHPTDTHGLCPNCGSQTVQPLYDVPRIPVHSVLLFETREAAVGYQRGTMQLGACDACGFVMNMAFDPGVHEYSPRYEETQGFSSTFNAFARSLAQRIVDRYDIRNKTVLEIGCGKGEFLTLLCELGNNRGIGVDPAFVPERMEGRTSADVQFIQDFYGPKYSHLQADLVCCRHTLEHIAPTYEFMTRVRESIGDRPDTLVLFELPDVLRVLQEGAFWDIYYEHCSYFSTGSLARLFRATGFEVIDLELDYDDQYIVIAARPVDVPTTPTLALEDDRQVLDDATRRFPQQVARMIDGWSFTLAHWAGEKQRVVLWGAGSKGVAFLTTLSNPEDVAAAVDINPFKQGHFMPGSGHEVLSPQQLVAAPPDHVIVMNPIYCNEVRAELQRLGLNPSVHSVNEPLLIDASRLTRKAACVSDN